MAAKPMTEEQKAKRYELENKDTLTPKERILLAALNDLRNGDMTGKDLELAKQAVADAEKELAEEEAGEAPSPSPEVPAGGEDVERVRRNQAV